MNRCTHRGNCRPVAVYHFDGIVISAATGLIVLPRGYVLIKGVPGAQCTVIEAPVDHKKIIAFVLILPAKPDMMTLVIQPDLQTGGSRQAVCRMVYRMHRCAVRMVVTGACGIPCDRQPG